MDDRLRPLSRNPSSVGLRPPPSPTRGEGRTRAPPQPQPRQFPAFPPPPSPFSPPYFPAMPPCARSVAWRAREACDLASGGSGWSGVLVGPCGVRRGGRSRAGAQRRVGRSAPRGPGCEGRRCRRTPAPAPGLPRSTGEGRLKRPQAARRAIGRSRRPRQAAPNKKPTEPGDGAFDPSVREVPVRVAGVTRTVPGGLSQAGPRPPRAPGVADKTGACPELVEARPRGASVGVETVTHITLRASARRSAQPSHRPPKGAAAIRVPSPLAGGGSSHAR